MKDKTRIGAPTKPADQIDSATQTREPLIDESQARRIMKELMELGIGMTGPAGMAFSSLVQGDRMRRRAQENYDDAVMRKSKPKPIGIKNGGAVMAGRGNNFKGVR